LYFVDSASNVCVGQFLGSQVFKVNPQSVISVFAGQNFQGFGNGAPATNGQFRNWLFDNRLGGGDRSEWYFRGE
jgi:hypothetical protein